MISIPLHMSERKGQGTHLLITVCSLKICKKSECSSIASIQNSKLFIETFIELSWNLTDFLLSHFFQIIGENIFRYIKLLVTVFVESKKAKNKSFISIKPQFVFLKCVLYDKYEFKRL